MVPHRLLRHVEGVERQGNLSLTNVTMHGMTPPKVVGVSKLAHPKPIQVDDYRFVDTYVSNARAAGVKHILTTRVCIPSPTMLHFRGGRDAISTDAYPTLEYDDERSGDFAPLRHLPESRIVVLGVMSSKKAELDDKNAMIRRLNEAAKFCPKD